MKWFQKPSTLIEPTTQTHGCLFRFQEDRRSESHMHISHFISLLLQILPQRKSLETWSCYFNHFVCHHLLHFKSGKHASKIYTSSCFAKENPHTDPHAYFLSPWAVFPSMLDPDFALCQTYGVRLWWQLFQGQSAGRMSTGCPQILGGLRMTLHCQGYAHL